MRNDHCMFWRYHLSVTPYTHAQCLNPDSYRISSYTQEKLKVGRSSRLLYWPQMDQAYDVKNQGSSCGHIFFFQFSGNDMSYSSLSIISSNCLPTWKHLEAQTRYFCPSTSNLEDAFCLPYAHSYFHDSLLIGLLGNKMPVETATLLITVNNISHELDHSNTRLWCPSSDCWEHRCSSGNWP